MRKDKDAPGVGHAFLLWFAIDGESSQRRVRLVVTEDAVQNREATIADRGKLGALGVDLAIELHQKLNCLHALVLRVEKAAVVNVLVSEIFDCVAENLKRVAGLWSNVAANWA
jgi:IS30 family transposase